MRIGDFVQRLDLARKALSLSSGQLSKELDVDKSVVRRWLAGVNMPSGHNLSRITQIIASRRAGFNLTDWERPLEEFAARLGLAETRLPAENQREPEFNLSGFLPPNVLEEARATTRFRGSTYEGFWRTTRLAIDPPGAYMRDYMMIWRSEQGLLRHRMGVYDMRFEGWTLPIQAQLFSIACDPLTGVFLFTIANAVLRHKAEVLDGLSLTLQRTPSGAPVAGAYVMERIADLSGDARADEAFFRDLTRHNPLVAADDVPAPLRDHLFTDVGPAAFAAGGPHLLTMPFAQSLSQGIWAARPGEAAVPGPSDQD